MDRLFCDHGTALLRVRVANVARVCFPSRLPIGTAFGKRIVTIGVPVVRTKGLGESIETAAATLDDYSQQRYWCEIDL